MRKIELTLLALSFVLASITLSSAQVEYQGVRFNLRVQKNFELKNDREISLQQQLQITPDFIEGDIIETDDPDFQEIDFIDNVFLSDDDDWDDNEPDDDDEEWNDEVDPSDRNTPEPRLPQDVAWAPDRIELGFRSATSLAYRIPLSRRFALINGYTYFIRPDRVNTHRIQTDLVYNRSVLDRRFTYSSRLRLQHSAGEMRRNIRVSSYGRLNSQLRLRGKVSPFVRAEILYRIRTQRKNSEFNRFRAAIGTDFRISSRHRIRCIYDFQRRFNVSRPENSSVLGFEYRFRLADSKIDHWDDD